MASTRPYWAAPAREAWVEEKSPPRAYRRIDAPPQPEPRLPTVIVPITFGATTKSLCLYPSIPAQEVEDIIRSSFHWPDNTDVGAVQLVNGDVLTLQEFCESPSVGRYGVTVLSRGDLIRQFADSRQSHRSDHSLDTRQLPSADGPLEVDVIYDGISHRIGLFPGIPVDELCDLLHGVFEVNDEEVVGFFDDLQGAFYPLESVCARPEILPSNPVRIQLRPSRLAQQPQPAPLQSSHEFGLTEDEANAIRDLIDREDPAVQAAYRVYPGLQHLVEAFIRLAQHSLNEQEAAAPARYSEPSFDDITEVEPRARKSERAAEVLAAELAIDASSASQYAIVLELMKAEQLSEEETIILLLMLKEDHPLVSAAHIAYDINTDLTDFLDTLKRIVHKVRRTVDRPSAQPQAAGAQRASSRASHRTEEEISDEAMNDIEIMCDVLAKLFERGAISETAYLALASLARTNDVLIKSAFVSFEYNGDLEDFVDTLLRILNKRAAEITEELLEQQQEPANPYTEYFSQERAAAYAIPEEQEQEQEEEEQEQEQEDDDSDDDDDDDDAAGPSDDIDEDLVLSLISHLAEDEHITPDDMLEFLNLVRSRDDVVMGAVDAYKVDNDFQEFSDTLQRILQRGKAAGSRSNSRQSERSEALSSEITQQMKELVTAAASDDDEREDLLFLLDQDDPIILSAFAQFLQNNDVTEFRATVLQHLEQVRQEQSAQLQLGTSSNEGEDEDRDEEDDDAGGEEAVQEELECIAVLHTEDVITQEEADRLARLVQERDPRLVAGFENFRNAGAWEDLQEVIKAILAAEDESNDNDNNEAQSEEPVCFQVLRTLSPGKVFSMCPPEAFEQVLQYLHDRESLSDNDVVILRQLWADEDALLQASVESFLHNGTIDSLVLNLQVCAKVSATD